MKKILLINGPNLNLLGVRRPEIYGSTTLLQLQQQLTSHAKTLHLDLQTFQSNHEGAIIDQIHAAYFQKIDGVIINPGAFTHYSYAIRDAIESVDIPTVEVHISNIYEREAFRAISVIEDVVAHRIYGKGLSGYFEALEYFVK